MIAETNTKEERSAGIWAIVIVITMIVACFIGVQLLVSWIRNTELEASGYDALITYAKADCPEIKGPIKTIMQNKGYISHGDQEKLLRACYDRERRLKKQYILEELK